MRSREETYKLWTIEEGVRQQEELDQQHQRKPDDGGIGLYTFLGICFMLYLFAYNYVYLPALLVWQQVVAYWDSFIAFFG